MSDKAIMSFYHELRSLFVESGDPKKAEWMSNYMKNQFTYYGLDSLTRRNLAKDLIRELDVIDWPELLDLVDIMWNDEYREMQYTVMDIVNRRLAKLEKSHLSFFESLIDRKSWWDTVDWIAPRPIGTLLLKFPELIVDNVYKWNSSSNTWYVRTSILFQLMYKEKTDFGLLCELILRTEGSKEFFINKASGWALRQYSKLQPEIVREFIVQNDRKLHNLTKREGLKWMKTHGKL